ATTADRGRGSRGDFRFGFLAPRRAIDRIGRRWRARAGGLRRAGLPDVPSRLLPIRRETAARHRAAVRTAGDSARVRGGGEDDPTCEASRGRENVFDGAREEAPTSDFRGQLFFACGGESVDAHATSLLGESFVSDD